MSNYNYVVKTEEKRKNGTTITSIHDYIATAKRVNEIMQHDIKVFKSDQSLTYWKVEGIDYKDRIKYTVTSEKGLIISVVK